MVKILVFFLISLHMLSAFAARPCEVYGISDSPQKLECQFGRNTVRLTCQDGEYFVNQNKVNVAFHMEVEDGPVPLVFKTAESTLTVMMYSRRIDAQMAGKAGIVQGTCR